MVKVIRLDPFSPRSRTNLARKKSRAIEKTSRVAGGAGAEWRRERQELSVDDAPLRLARRWSPTTNGQSTTTLRIE
jgi:hypothetical protein